MSMSDTFTGASEVPPSDEAVLAGGTRQRRLCDGLTARRQDGTAR